MSSYEDFVNNWLAKAATPNEREIILATMHLQSVKDPKTHRQLRKKLYELQLKEAEAGNPEYQLQVGRRYLSGDFGKIKGRRDYNTAMRWFELASTVKPEALMWIGNIHYRGLGNFPKNPEKGAAFYEEAAIRGDGNARSALSYVYSDGIGRPKNMVEAAKWWLTAHSESMPTPLPYEINSVLSQEQRAEAEQLAAAFKAKYPLLPQ